MQATMQPAQQQQQQQQQPKLMTPPNVITTKDILYLKDVMSWLLLATKKCAHFSGEVQDPQLKQTIDRIGPMHQRHYNLVLQHCQTNNAMQMASLQQNQMMQHLIDEACEQLTSR